MIPQERLVMDDPKHDVSILLQFEALRFDPAMGMTYQELSLLCYYLGSLAVTDMKADGKLMMLYCLTTEKTAEQWSDQHNWGAINVQFAGRWVLRSAVITSSRCIIL